MELKVIEVDLRTYNFIRLMKRFGNGVLDKVKIQNGIPMRIEQGFQTIDLGNSDEINNIINQK